MLGKIGIHKWKQCSSGSAMTPIADKCEICKLVRVFQMWGYTYHRDT